MNKDLKTTHHTRRVLRLPFVRLDFVQLGPYRRKMKIHVLRHIHCEQRLVELLENHTYIGEVEAVGKI